MTVPVPLPGWLSEVRRITVLTGAGISTDSGIPDYRGPNGVWTRDPDAEKLVTLGYYLAVPDIRRRSWLLHQAAGSDPALVHEIHGTVNAVVCTACGDRT